MADLKKTPLKSVDSDVISMVFDTNPNIPTANYSEETLNKINETLVKKMRAEKIKKLITAELKQEKKNDDSEMAFSFSFKGM